MKLSNQETNDLKFKISDVRRITRNDKYIPNPSLNYKKNVQQM